MPTPHYLYVHIPGRGQFTLSLPGGFERAFRNNQLPDSTEIWHAATGVWIPMCLHPEIARLQEIALAEADVDYEFEFQLTEPPPVMSAPAEPDYLDDLVDAAFAEAPTPETSSEDPNQLPLIAVGDWELHMEEFSRFVARSSAQEQRREAVRVSGGVRRSDPLPVVVAGVPDEVHDPYEVPAPELSRFRTRLLVGAMVVLVAMGIGGWLWYNAPNLAPLGGAVTAQELTARQRDSLARASAASNARFSAPNPLADLATELENDLRIAEIVIWQPATDFGSEEQVMRSSRKLDAVRNSIGLYRLGAWRLADSLKSPGDPRLEPFPEAERIDAVLGIMQASVVLLDSLIGHYQVIGEVLVFDNATDAEHYTTTFRIADSLLRAPVELDSFPTVRAPRRVVTRLLSTLPPAIAAPPQPTPPPDSSIETPTD